MSAILKQIEIKKEITNNIRVDQTTLSAKIIEQIQENITIKKISQFSIVILPSSNSQDPFEVKINVTFEPKDNSNPYHSVESYSLKFSTKQNAINLKNSMQTILNNLYLGN